MDHLYSEASPFFPQDPNYGTITYNTTPATTSSGGGGTTIVNNNVVNNGILTVTADGGSISSGSVIFFNSNNVSFGMLSGVITASASFSGGTGGDLSFANSNGITFGVVGSTVTASHNGLTNAGAFLGTGATASFRFTSQNSQLQFTSAMSNFLGTSYTTHTHTQYLNTSQSSVFQLTSQMTDYLDTSYTSHTHADYLGTDYTSHTHSEYLGTAYTSHTHSQYLNTSQSSVFRHTSADSQLQFTSAMSDYLDTGYTTHTHTQSAQTGISSVAVSDVTYTSGQISFRDGNGVSFASGTGQGISVTHGLQFTSNTSAITASALNTSQSSLFQHTSATSNITSNALHTSAARIQGVIGSNTTYTSGSISLRDLNGISWQSTTGQAFQITHALQYTSNTSAITSNALNTSQSSLFRHTSANSQLQFTSQMSDYLGTDYTTHTHTYAASNHSHGNPTLALTNLSGTTASNSAGLTLSLSAGAGGGIVPVASASNGSFSFTTLAFSDANNVTFGTSAGSIITASVAAPGAAAENNWHHLLGANTAGNTTASGSTIGLSGINLTLSGTDGSNINISAPAVSSLSGTGQVSIATAGSTISIGVPGQVTMSGFNTFVLREIIAVGFIQRSVIIQPMNLPLPMQFNRFYIPLQYSNATNSSNSVTLSLYVGIYTRNSDSMSLLTSVSNSYGITASGTVGSYSLFGGLRYYSLGMTTTLAEGNYYLALLGASTTGGGAGQTFSMFQGSQINLSFSGYFGSVNAASNGLDPALGMFSATTAALPGAIPLSQINGTAGFQLRPPAIGIQSI